MKVLGEWKNISIYGVGTGFLRLEERAGHYWIALYEKLSAGDAIQEKTAVAVDAIKENPEAAAGAALTAAASGAVKSIAAALGADRSAMRRIQVFENDSAKEFSKTFAKSNEDALRTHMIFEKELSDLADCSRSGNTVTLKLGQEYHVTFEGLLSGSDNCGQFIYEMERIKDRNIQSRIKKGIDWTLDSSGLLTIKGWGKMPDWDWDDGAVDTPWHARCNDIKSVHISEGFTNIGEHAFYGCKNLTKAYIPNSVAEIRYSAFQNCESLTSIDIPCGVTEIGGGAFESCKNLKSIVIPNSVTSIGSGAFNFCENLTSIRIPQGVTTIEHRTFEYCEGLTRIDIPNSVTSIGSGAFLFCNNLTSIHIPYGVTDIGSEAFQYCKKLISINIPNSVTSIDYGAFGECESLSEIRIPSSVTKLGSGVFKNCKKLKRVWMPTRFDGPLFKLRYGISKDIVTFT